MRVSSTSEYGRISPWQVKQISDELRAFENKVKDSWEAGKIKVPIHLSGGHEQALTEIFYKHIGRRDYVFSNHRNHEHYLLHDGDRDKLWKEIHSEPEGLCKGRAGSMNIADRTINFYASAIVSGLVSVAVGVAWVLKERRGKRNGRPPTRFKDPHVWVFVGDGATEMGHFYEAILFSEGWDLPITFVVEDNDRATCTTTKQRLGMKKYEHLRWCRKVWITHYTPTYPHVGSGKYVAF